MAGMNARCFVTLLLVQVGLLSANFVDRFEQDRAEQQHQAIRNEFDNNKYQDCDDVRENGGYETSGDYHVYLNTSEVHRVSCRFEAGFTATAIMLQKYGQMSFAQPWYLYKAGFHSPTDGDFWIGLDHIRTLTLTGRNVLTVTMQDWYNQIKTLRYNHFSVGPEVDGYRLSIGGYASSLVLPDDFGHNNGAPFATLDRPDVHNCAGHQRGGWWYNYCTFVLPTGKYYPGGHYTPLGGFYDGIYYKDWAGYGYSLKYIRLELSRY